MYSDRFQSSSKKGSSSPWDLSFGNRVERRAKCVVKDRSGRGYDCGGDSNKTCILLISTFCQSK